MSRIITAWNPEDRTCWEKSGKGIARRNLWISIPSLLLAFSVWMVWSMVVVKLPDIGFTYTPNQLFWLASLPALSGATLRIFYSFMIPIFGGRKWTALSTASLLIPAMGIGFAVQNPHTGFPVMLVLALLCGFGGGNFSSSMSNISFFFPKAQKGTALGLNAGLGNLGVSVMQFVVPLVITMGVFSALGGGDPQHFTKGALTKDIWLQNAGFIWVPFILICSITAWFGMNDLSCAKGSFKSQAVIFKNPHNWIMCWLYLGTFGSFIGFSAGFALLTKKLFPGVDPTAFAFLGPLVGALARPVGGWISDKVGGAGVTFWTFLCMVFAVIGVIYFLPGGGQAGNFNGFLSMFLVLFTLTGIGNASTFRMIPLIYLSQHQADAKGRTVEQISGEAGKEAAAAIGFAGAIGAYGGFFIPRGFGASLAATGSPRTALIGFIAFYLTCIVCTWWFYSRKGAKTPC